MTTLTATNNRPRPTSVVGPKPQPQAAAVKPQPQPQPAQHNDAVVIRASAAPIAAASVNYSRPAPASIGPKPVADAPRPVVDSGDRPTPVAHADGDSDDAIKATAKA